MGTVRRRLSWIVAFWLVAYASTTILSAMGACVAAAALESVTCTCGHAAGAECPMHHAPKSPRPGCSCRSTGDTAATALPGVLLVAAVVPVATALHYLDMPRSLVRFESSARDDRPRVPEPPPPKRALCDLAVSQNVK